MKQLATITILLAAVTAAAAPVGTSFTWQGTLATGGALVDGAWDLRFTLYDAGTGGVAVAGPVTLEDVAVSQGRAAVEVDLGDVFDGGAYWLEVAGRPGASTGPFTALGPRRPLDDAAFTQHAAEAVDALEAATTGLADSADTLDGLHAASYLAWGNLTGVPADLADGDDDALDGLVCAAGELPKWTGSAWGCADDDTMAFARTVTVGPVGTPTANGAALLAAAAAMPYPASAAEGWLLRLEPGEYDLGAAYLEIKPWTVLAGAGRSATLITSARCQAFGDSLRGTVHAGDHTELRDLTVHNTCAGGVGQKAAAVSSSQPGAVFRRLQLMCPGSAEYVYGLVSTGPGVVVDQVLAAGGSDATAFGCGIESRGANALILDSYGVGTHVGLRLAGNGSRVLRGAYLATGTGAPGFQANGLELESCNNAQIVDVTAEGEDHGVNASAYMATSLMTLSRCTLNAPVVARANPGFTLLLALEHSRVEASGPTIDAGERVAVGVAASQLNGGPVLSLGGTITCAGVWDESLTFSASTCP